MEQFHCWVSARSEHLLLNIGALHWKNIEYSHGTGNCTDVAHLFHNLIIKVLKMRDHVLQENSTHHGGKSLGTHTEMCRNRRKHTTQQYYQQ